ncbi:peptidylprolyl isomerase [bacterium]|nr:peptidylprolyl isomerase [bacterium]
MRRILILAGVLAVGLGLFALGYFSKILLMHLYQPRVLAQVDGIAISEAELKREILFLKVSKNAGLSDITREDVLNRLINDRLILNEAGRLNLVVSKEAVENYLKSFWENYSSPEVNSILREHQISASAWREIIRRRILIERVIEQAVENQVQVSQDEVEEYYWTHLLEFHRQRQVHARQIVVETLAQAETLSNKLDEGADFKNLAAEYSLGPEKDQGGDLGWVGKSDLPQFFSRVLFKMKVGEISKPVATEYGYHLFLLEARKKGGKISLAQARDQIAENLMIIKIERAFQIWMEDLRARAKISIENIRGVK